MKTSATLLLLVFGVLSTALGQSNTQDSLLLKFNSTAEADSVRYEAGITLAKFNMRFGPDSSRATGNKVLQFAQNTGNKVWEAQAIKWIGITHAQQGQFIAAKDYFLKNYELVKELGNEQDVGIILGNIGTVFYEMGNYPQAQEYILQSLKIAEKINDEPTISRALNNLGNVHNDQRNLKTSLEYYQKSLAIKEKMGLKESLPYVHNNIGLIHSECRLDYLAGTITICSGSYAPQRAN